MKKVYNKFGYGAKYGGCLLACLESLLERPLNLISFHTSLHLDQKDWDWLETVNEDLKDEINYKMVRIDKPRKRKLTIDYYNYKDNYHVVIGRNGKIIHDPSSKVLVSIGEWDQQSVKDGNEFFELLWNGKLEPITYYELVKC